MGLQAEGAVVCATQSSTKVFHAEGKRATEKNQRGMPPRNGSAESGCDRTGPRTGPLFGVRISNSRAPFFLLNTSRREPHCPTPLSFSTRRGVREERTRHRLTATQLDTTHPRNTSRCCEESQTTHTHNTHRGIFNTASTGHHGANYRAYQGQDHQGRWHLR